MSAAFDAGADILNDVSAMEDDPRLAAFCAKTKIPVILMHKKGNPAIMQNDTNYADVFAEARAIVEGEPYTLLEAVAERIAEVLLEKYPLIERLKVTVHKPYAPIPGKFADAAVTIRRARPKNA